MLLYHLWLLLQKSLRYAWRRRICRCCPKIAFELLIPAVCLLFLILIRWIHTPSEDNNENPPLGGAKPTRIHVKPSALIQSRDSTHVFNNTLTLQCPSQNIIVRVVDSKLLSRLKHLCPQNRFILSSKSEPHNESFLLSATPTGYIINYRCRHDDPKWCQNVSTSNNIENSKLIQHPAAFMCSDKDIHVTNRLLKNYLALESVLRPPIKKRLSVHTWPCPSYAFDPIFDYVPRFVLTVILIFIDGCILFSFNLLFLALIDEKHQGITELLRLISVRPILNSLAWFLREFFIQSILNIFLILILKISFNGGIYLPYVSIWLIIPTIILWTIQVLSQSILIGHFFNRSIRASLFSWLVYFISCWLALSSSVRLPIVLHLLVSTWSPFYSIKRLFILLFRVNADIGRHTQLATEIILIWLCMLVGSLLMWLLAYYFDQIRPGKYGIPRSWLWPLDYCRNRQKKKQTRSDSVAMQMVETLPDANTTVRVNNLTKTYGHFNTEQQLAVDHISFKLDKSIIHGLIGQNGAGKTSTMEMMCGLLSCDCGTIEIHDKDLYENLHELQKCIGYCPQQDMFFSHLTVQEQLEFYARVRSGGSNVDYNQIDELLTMMEMNTHRRQLCHTLSGGMKRKLSILCAFVGQANVILLGRAEIF